jgi:hypothetical protein
MSNMSSIISQTTKSKSYSESERLISGRVIPIVSLIGIAGNPAFYFICKNFGYNENLVLRIIAAVLFIPLLIKKRNYSDMFMFYSEVVFAFSLPFLFSFFLYTNELNLYWRLSLLFAGGAYGVVSRKLSTAIVVFTLSCMIAFVSVNYLIRIVPVARFYGSMSSVISALGCVIVMMLAKNKFKSIMMLSIEISTKNNVLIENNKLKEAAEKNLQLQREVYDGLRLKLIADMSKGFSREIGNTLTIVKGQAFLIRSKIDDKQQKEKIQTVLKITDNATALVHQLWNFPEIGVPYKKFLNIDDLLHDSICHLQDEVPGLNISIHSMSRGVFIDCNPIHLRNCFCIILKYIGSFKLTETSIKITYRIESPCEHDSEYQLSIFAGISEAVDPDIERFCMFPLPLSQYTRELIVAYEIIKMHNGTFVVGKDIGSAVTCLIRIPFKTYTYSISGITDPFLSLSKKYKIALVMNSTSLVSCTIHDVIEALGHRATLYGNLSDFRDSCMIDTTSVDLYIIDLGKLNTIDDIQINDLEQINGTPIVIIDYEADPNSCKAMSMKNCLFLDKPVDEMILLKCISQLCS